MWQGVLAVLSGPIVYGIVCVPTNWLVVRLFPSHFDENWVTRSPRLLVLLVSLTVLFAGAAGLVTVLIAGDRILWHVVALCALLVAIGVGVQRQFWDRLPLWYHLAFFVLLILGTVLGAALGGLVTGTA